jgi:hypothetical protein
MNEFPQYTVHWKSGQGELIRPAQYATTIFRHEASTPHITLSGSGYLHLEPGYVWDFGSGPAIDTPDMVYASLAHDALYELMQKNLLPWSLRKKVDQYFRGLLKQAGMGWLRRQWVYAGVRLGYPLTQLFKKK